MRDNLVCFFKNMKRMWVTKDDCEWFKKRLYHDLSVEVCQMVPGSRIKQILVNRLERLSKCDRQKIVNKTHDGCTPLFISCKRGLVEVVKYLCYKCGADVELMGLFEVPEDKVVRYVTPLWCAAVQGRIEILKILIKKGANINSMCNTGSTAVRSACIMANEDTVKFLVRRGVDILRPNFRGETCLMNSVQSVTLCEFLLDNGAITDAQDSKSRTALHYAIEKDCYDTVRLLIARGANPYLRSCFNDDALHIACITGTLQIFNYLLTVLKLTPHEVANAHELLGSTLLNKHHDMSMAKKHWRIAATTRESAGVTKPVMEPIKAFAFVKEIETLDDIETVLLDMNSVKVQSVLICQRVLGLTHKNTLGCLMLRGAEYMNSSRYENYIQLWLYVIELYICEETILFIEVLNISNSLVATLFCLLHRPGAKARKLVLFEDVFHALKLIGNQIESCMTLLSVQPECRQQQERFDKALNIIIHFIYIILKVTETQQERDKVNSYVRYLVSLFPRTFSNGMTLLHLSVTKSTELHSVPWLKWVIITPFPNCEVAQLLLECHAPVNFTANDGSSALLLACHPMNYKKEV